MSQHVGCETAIDIDINRVTDTDNISSHYFGQQNILIHQSLWDICWSL